MFLSSTAQKEKVLTELLSDPRFLREKIIVFVNEKTHADGVGRIVERAGRQCVVLHGGKSQDEREESLEKFRRGGFVMVATDVLGRGIDVPNIAHVINYDLPTRSIEVSNCFVCRCILGWPLRLVSPCLRFRLLDVLT